MMEEGRASTTRTAPHTDLPGQAAGHLVFLLTRCDDREHTDPDGTLPRDPDPAGLDARRGVRPGRGPLVLAEAAGEGAADRRPGMGARALRGPAGRVGSLYRLRGRRRRQRR